MFTKYVICFLAVYVDHAFYFFQKTVRVDTINLVQKSSKAELSSGYFKKVTHRIEAMWCIGGLDGGITFRYSTNGGIGPP